MRLLAIALASVLLAVLLSGCPGGVCGCGEPPAPTAVELAYCDLDVAVLDNGGEFAFVSEDNVVPRAAIGLELVLRSREELCAAPKWDNPLVTAAYACSCPDFGGFEVSVLDTIVGISVRPTTQYNEAYGAGAELAEVFRVEAGYRNYVSIANYLAQEPNPTLVTGESAFDAPSGQAIRLYAAEPADHNEALALDISITLSDGRALTARSPTIVAQ